MFRNARIRLKLISGSDELTAFKILCPDERGSVGEMTAKIRNYVECMHYVVSNHLISLLERNHFKELWRL